VLFLAFAQSGVCLVVLGCAWLYWYSVTGVTGHRAPSPSSSPAPAQLQPSSMHDEQLAQLCHPPATLSSPCRPTVVLLLRSLPLPPPAAPVAVAVAVAIAIAIAIAVAVAIAIAIATVTPTTALRVPRHLSTSFFWSWFHFKYYYFLLFIIVSLRGLPLSMPHHPLSNPLINPLSNPSIVSARVELFARQIDKLTFSRRKAPDRLSVDLEP